jgi:hypothetical protein
MKKTIATILTAFVGIAAYGQGTVDFGNFPGNAINYAAGTPKAGQPIEVGMFTVELYFAAGSGQAETALQRFTTPVQAQIAPIAGYFLGGTATVPGAAGGTAASFQVRAWSGTFTSYAAALASGSSSTFIGKSAVFNVAALGGAGQPPSPPASLNMPGFTVAPVPEPTAIVLGALGAGALLLLRRRK